MSVEDQAAAPAKPLPAIDREKVLRTARIHDISEEKAEQLIRSTHSQEELDSAASASGRWE